MFCVSLTFRLHQGFCRSLPPRFWERALCLGWLVTEAAVAGPSVSHFLRVVIPFPNWGGEDVFVGGRDLQSSPRPFAPFVDDESTVNAVGCRRKRDGALSERFV